MSSKKPSKGVSTDPNDTTLQQLEAKEIVTLTKLGYRAEHINAMLPAEARVKIADNAARPGSKIFMQREAARTGAPDLSGRFSDEEIEKRQKPDDGYPKVEFAHNEVSAMMFRNEETGELEPVDVITQLRDEWYKKNAESLAAGQGTIFEKAAKKSLDKYGRRMAFRFLDPTLVAKMGDDGFEKFIDPETKQSVEAGGQYLAWRPKEIDDRIEKERLQAVQNTVRTVADDFADTVNASGTRTTGKVKIQRGAEGYIPSRPNPLVELEG